MSPNSHGMEIRGEDDLKWVLAGTDYLGEVDADTPDRRRELTALRQRLLERMDRSETGC